jgi:DNA repair exonuclease SbcCD nuclease subunit
MVKIGLIGDLHFANHKRFGEPTGHAGVNTRLSTITDVCRWAGEIFEQENVSCVYVLGDVTHHHGMLTPPVASRVVPGLYSLFNGDMSLVVMSGNHDIDANGRSIIPYIRIQGDDVTMMDSWYSIYKHFEGVNIWAVSYGENPLEVFRKMQSNSLKKMTPAVVLLHHHIEGAVHGSHEFEPPGGIKLSDIPSGCLVFSGHYHKRQKLGKAIQYIGAPLQHDFGEADYIPGITVLTLDDGKVAEEKFIETPQTVAPRFHIIPHDTKVADLPGVVDEDYYRIDLPTDVDPTIIHPLQQVLKHVLVKPIPIDAQTRSRVSQYIVDITGEELNLVSLDDVIDTYAHMNIEDSDQAESLAEQGKQLLKDALGGSS